MKPVGIIDAMRHLPLLATGVMALLFLGCAGSSDSGGGVIVDGITDAPRIEAVTYLDATMLTDPCLVTVRDEAACSARGIVAKYSPDDLRDPQKVDPADLRFPENFGIQDPENLQTTERVIFQLVNYTRSGTSITRNILPVTGWFSGDTFSAYGRLAVDSGLYDISSTESPTRQIINASYEGRSYSAFYSIRPRQVRLLGRLVNGSTGNPVAGVEIRFYGPQDVALPDGPQLLLATVRTSFDGTFRASVPTTATRFAITTTSIGTSFARQYGYKSTLYQTGRDDCRPAITGVDLSVGTRHFVDETDSAPTTNGTIIVYPVGAVDAGLPDGCPAG